MIGSYSPGNNPFFMPSTKKIMSITFARVYVTSVCSPLRKSIVGTR